MTEIRDIRNALYAARSPYHAMQHVGSGFYAIFLKSDHALPYLHMPDDGLLYIGETRVGFSTRDHSHPRNGHSGFCTVRKSLGALLKTQLSLSVTPPTQAQLRSRKRYFRFTKSGEARLSEWMKGALYFSRVPDKGDVKTIEQTLISKLKPPLNLRGWPNPQSPMVKKRRYECFEEAIAHTAIAEAS